MKKEWFRVVNQASQTDVYIYGEISPFAGEDTVNYADFQAAFRQLENTTKQCNVRINCVGGSIMEGLAIYDMMRASAMRVTTIVEGMAASMGGIIALAGDERLIYPNASFMIHRAAGWCGGDADSIRAYANQVEQFEKRIKDILTERTGMTPQQVDDLMKPGIDTWINAEDAVNIYHLAHAIAPSAKGIATPVNNITGKKPEEVYQQFYNVLQIPQTDMNEKVKTALIALCAAVGPNVTLSAKSTDDEFEALIKKAADKLNALHAGTTALTQKVTELSNQLNAISEQEIDDLLHNAVTQKTIAAEAVPAMRAFGLANKEQLQTLLNALKPVDLVALPDAKKHQAANAIADERANWTYDDWAEKDGHGLERLALAQPDAFNKLVDAKTKAARGSHSIN